ncbi:unnamed protein product [Discula destructiva]
MPPKTVQVYENEACASSFWGPLLMAQQPAGCSTIVIAVVGSYKSDLPRGSPPFRLDHDDKFLALLSTAAARSSHSNEAEEMHERRTGCERSLPPRHAQPNPNPICARYVAMIAPDGNWQYHGVRSMRRFCDTRCEHGPAPSRFPGDRAWTFAAGEESFDASVDSGRANHGEDALVVTPDCIPPPGYARALVELRGMLCRAVKVGLTDLSAVVSATDGDTLLGEDRETRRAELKALGEMVAAEVGEWIAMGWTVRERCLLMKRSSHTTRRVGVLGAVGGMSPFVMCDE